MTEQISKEKKEVLEKNEEKINKLSKAIGRKAIILDTGVESPTSEKGQSWIGKVCWRHGSDDTRIPLNEDREPMKPLATIFLKDLPYCPEELKGITLITIYMKSEDVWYGVSKKDELESNIASNFLIRTYSEYMYHELKPCEHIYEEIEQYPLTPKLVEDDFPMREDEEVWEDKEVFTEEVNEMIDELEEEGLDIYDFQKDYSGHKIGGYPAYIQGGHMFKDANDYKFVLQISSDDNANFNIVDGGSFYFFYNPKKKKWKVHWDCF